MKRTMLMGNARAVFTVLCLLVAVATPRTVVVRAGDSGLAFEGMQGMVQH